MRHPPSPAGALDRMSSFETVSAAPMPTPSRTNAMTTGAIESALAVNAMSA